MWAENRPGGGTVVRFTLPLTGTPPYVAPEEEMTGASLSTSSEPYVGRRDGVS
jgi:hypothetical protein